MTIKNLTKEIEKVSQNYTNKFSITRDPNWYMLKLSEEIGELTKCYLMLSRQARTKGKSEKELKDDFAKEIADVFGHILLLADHMHVDIEKEVEEKWLSWNKKE